MMELSELTLKVRELAVARGLLSVRSGRSSAVSGSRRSTHTIMCRMSTRNRNEE